MSDECFINSVTPSQAGFIKLKVYSLLFDLTPSMGIEYNSFQMYVSFYKKIVASGQMVPDMFSYLIVGLRSLCGQKKICIT